MSESAEKENVQTEAGAAKTNEPLLSVESDPWEAADWQKNVPEKFKDEKGELKIKELAKSYVHIEKRVGSGDVPPKTAEEYKVDVRLPSGVDLTPERRTEFLKSCHSAGMTNKQVQFVMDKYSDVLQQFTDDKDSTIAGLKKEWGESFDGNMDLARKAFEALVDEPDRAAMLKIGNNPALIRMLARLGAELKEDSPPTGEGIGVGDVDIDVLMKSHAYWNKQDPEHEKVKAKVSAYFAKKSRKSA